MQPVPIARWAILLISGFTPYALAGGACNDYGCTSGGSDNGQKQRVIKGAVQGLGDFLQNNADRQAEQEQHARDAENAREAAKQADAARRAAQFDQYVNQLGGDDWEADAARQANTGKAVGASSGCNCRQVIGQCQATLSDLKKTGKTGWTVRVSSSEAQCSRVSWYLDNTPQLTVLNHRASTVEAISSQKPLSRTNLDVERCEICAPQ
ncbi:hypothetical protein [Pseudomonas sp. NPDC007930]|uniref:hypothetical protein n=1 Tax=Pseudomonas sp. NPDC007930 TaxID=3364417 RepID=UPI0036DFC9EF